MIPTIPHNKPTFGLEEEIAVCNVLKSGYVSQGVKVEEFENNFCKFFWFNS